MITSDKISRLLVALELWRGWQQRALTAWIYGSFTRVHKSFTGKKCTDSDLGEEGLDLYLQLPTSPYARYPSIVT